MTLGFVEYFIIAVVVIVFAVDVVLYTTGGDAKTISDKFAAWAMRYPIVAFLLGFLGGHLVWPNHGYCP